MHYASLLIKIKTNARGLSAKNLQGFQASLSSKSRRKRLASRELLLQIIALKKWVNSLRISPKQNENSCLISL